MTRLHRALVRLCDETDPRTGRPFVLRLEPGGRLVRIRPLGLRTWYTVTTRQLWQLGAQNQADADRAERQRLREERRRARRAAGRNRR